MSPITPISSNFFLHDSSITKLGNNSYYLINYLLDVSCVYVPLLHHSYTMSPDFNDGFWPGAPDNVLPDGEYFRSDGNILERNQTHFKRI